MGLFTCDGTCATADALRSEIGYLRELLKSYVERPAPPEPDPFLASLDREQEKGQQQEQKKPRNPFAHRVISSHHPRMLAQLSELEQQKKGKLP